MKMIIPFTKSKLICGISLIDFFIFRRIGKGDDWESLLYYPFPFFHWKMKLKRKFTWLRDYFLE